MGIKFYESIDLDLNEIKNNIVEKLDNHPSPDEARFYYNSIYKKFYAYNNTEWIDLGNSGWRPAVDTIDDLVLMNNLEDGLVVYVKDIDMKYAWDEPTQKWILPNISETQLFDIDWKPSVESFLDIATTYPNAEVGDSVLVKDERTIYTLDVDLIWKPPSLIGYAEFRLDAIQSIQNDTAVAIIWSNTITDKYGFWNNAQPTRFTIPANVSSVKVSTKLQLENIRVGRLVYMEVLLNGQAVDRDLFYFSVSSDYIINLITKILPVNTNDYIEIIVYQNSGGARSVLTDYTYCQLEVYK